MSMRANDPASALGLFDHCPNLLIAELLVDWVVLCGDQKTTDGDSGNNGKGTTYNFAQDSSRSADLDHLSSRSELHSDCFETLRNAVGRSHWKAVGASVVVPCFWYIVKIGMTPARTLD